MENDQIINNPANRKLLSEFWKPIPEFKYKMDDVSHMSLPN